MRLNFKKLYLTRRRLLMAAAGALTAHVLLMSAGHLAITQFAIPSDANRILVFNLQSTTQDSVNDAELPNAETINDAKQGEAKSIVEQAPPEQPASVPAIGPSSESEIIEVSDAPQPEKPAAPEIVTQQQQPASAAPELPTTEESEATTSEEVAVITDSQSTLALPAPDLAAELETESVVAVSESQEKMLEQKLKQWMENSALPENDSDSFAWQHQGQDYVANFNRLPATGDMGLDELVVEVVTQQDGQELTKTLRMKKLAFSNFAQFVHRWDSRTRIHDDVLEGRFHSNTTIYVEPDWKVSPVFNGKVTTAASRVDIDRSRGGASKKNIFRGGLETRVKRIKMPPPRTLFDDELETGQKNTRFFASDTRIAFLDNGSYQWQPLNSDVVHTEQLGNDPVYLFSAPDAALHVSGMVNGKVLVYSPKRIVIEGNIFYANAREIGGDGDYLGLVSDRDVVIARPSVTGPGNLTISASIYAKKRFLVRSHTVKKTGTLYLFGSVTAGSLVATEPRYATKVVFDKRLEHTRPPSYPVTDRYEIAKADVGWKAKPLHPELESIFD